MKILAKGLDFYGLLHNDFQFCQAEAWQGAVLLKVEVYPGLKLWRPPGGNTEAFAGRHFGTDRSMPAELCG